MTTDEQRSKVLEEKRHVSSKISDLSRYIGFGLVAVAYAILTSDSASVQKLYEDRQLLIILSAGFGTLAVIFDYVQFLAGYLAVQTAISNAGGGFKYDDGSLSYKLRTWAFWVKQVAALAGAVIFAAALAFAVVRA